MHGSNEKEHVILKLVKHIENTVPGSSRYWSWHVSRKRRRRRRHTFFSDSGAIQTSWNAETLYPLSTSLWTNVSYELLVSW